MKPRFFDSQLDLRAWLDKHHDKEVELWVGFRKKSSGQQSISYQEALDEALCVGWIDGLRKSLDASSYTIRFTPRKGSSIWSLNNVRHVERLKKAGLMKATGLQVFGQRKGKRTGVYSFENAPRELSDVYLKRFHRNKTAWQFFERQPPFFRKMAVFWVMSAKKEETRARRLEQLVEACSKRVRLGVITGQAKKDI
jgi:uncharacterized protein YdeI (YjbR/CyaY-like superfamily)